MNRHESMTNTIHKNTNEPQKKYHLETVSKNILLDGSIDFFLNPFCIKCVTIYLSTCNFALMYLYKVSDVNWILGFCF